MRASPTGMRLGAMREAGRFLVPTERRVVRFFLRNLHVPHQLHERVLVLLADAGLSSLPGARRVPRVGSAPTDGGPTAREWDVLLPMWTAVAEELEARARDTLFAGRSWRPLLQRDDAGESLVAILFPTDGADPAAILKVRRPRTPGRSLAREAGVLERLAERLPDALRPTVPRVLGFWAVGGVEALLLSALPGRPAYVEMQAGWRPLRRAGRHLSAAARWLAEFHRATRSDGSFDPLAEEPALHSAASEAEALGEGVPDWRWYEDLRADLAERPLPLAARHGDFWARNVLLDERGRVSGVVDWEEASCRPLESPRLTGIADGGEGEARPSPAGLPEGPPFVDLFHFALSYGLNALWSRYRRGAADHAFRRTFVEENPVSRAVRAMLRGYCRETGLRSELLRPLFRFYLWTGFQRAGADDEKGRWLRFDRILAKADRSVFSG